MNKVDSNTISKSPYAIKTLKWFLILLLACGAIYFLTKPIRINSAAKYVSEGDQYLKEKKYLTAKLAYQKALILNNEKTTENKINLTDKASVDVSSLEQFYKDHDMKEELTKFDEANKVPVNESDAVSKSKELLESKEYQLAIIPAKTALEMDANYRDAWLYLGIANLECSQKLQVGPAVKNHYLEEAKLALHKAKEIDPIYQPTIEYLGVIEKQ